MWGDVARWPGWGSDSGRETGPLSGGGVLERFPLGEDLGRIENLDFDGQPPSCRDERFRCRPTPNEFGAAAALEDASGSASGAHGAGFQQTLEQPVRRQCCREQETGHQVGCNRLRMCGDDSSVAKMRPESAGGLPGQ